MAARIARPARQEHGFTLIEMMIALAIFVAVMTLVFGQLTNGIQQTANVDRASNSNSTARLVVESLKTELRQSSTSDSDLETITLMTATTLDFYTPDRQSPMHLLRIAYRLRGTVLERSSVASINRGAPPWVFPATGTQWIPIVTGLTNTDLFTYQASDGSAATTSGEVSIVGLHFILSSGVSSPATVVYRAEVQVRSHQ